MEKRVERKIYEIPEDELRRLVISKIPRVRPIEGKPKSFKEIIIGGLSNKSCEICGEHTVVTNQCPYCGRLVGAKAKYMEPGNINILKPKMRWYHENCFDSQFGCCKVCAEFIRENSEKISCDYCGALFYRFQERCPNCGAPLKK